MKQSSSPKATASNGNNAPSQQLPQRLAVQKTYKLFIGGKFPRTESGRYLSIQDASGAHLAHVCRASRKDFRNAVQAARKAQAGWQNHTAYHKGQILYRMAEVMETRRAPFIENLQQLSMPPKAARQACEQAIDSLVYQAGWADKYQQVFGSINPVASPHMNFSLPEPMGVVGLMLPEQAQLFGMVSSLAAAMVGGNACILLVPPRLAPLAIDLAEVIGVSDVPPGVVNILSGQASELLFHFGSHQDVNAVVYLGDELAALRELQSLATHNLKRIIHRPLRALNEQQLNTPYAILDTQEIKTVWHPAQG